MTQSVDHDRVFFRTFRSSLMLKGLSIRSDRV